MHRTAQIVLLLVTLIPTALAGCGPAPQSADAATTAAAAALDPNERFGAFTRAERWYLHYSLHGLNEGIQFRNEVLVPLVEAGDLPAIKAFARAYAGGRGPLGGPQDLEKSFELTTRAAEMGDADAMAKLGDKYRRGSGSAKDSEAAIIWLERAFERSGDPDAALGLNAIYASNSGTIPKDEAKAEKWMAREEKARKRFADAGIDRQADSARLEETLTQGVTNGPEVIRRFHEQEFADIEARAAQGERRAIMTLADVKLGKHGYWRATSLHIEKVDVVGGLALLEQAYGESERPSEAQRIAERIAVLYERGPEAIRDPALTEAWRAKAATASAASSRK